VSAHSKSSWFAVRAFIKFDDLDDCPVYEERITLWRCSSIEDAVTRGGVEAEAYASVNGAINLGAYQAYSLTGAPKSGHEVFSLMRSSSLSLNEYLDRFFFDSGNRSTDL